MYISEIMESFFYSVILEQKHIWLVVTGSQICFMVSCVMQFFWMHDFSVLILKPLT